jgi:hypothetical protein
MVHPLPVCKPSGISILNIALYRNCSVFLMLFFLQSFRKEVWNMYRGGSLQVERQVGVDHEQYRLDWQTYWDHHCRTTHGKVGAQEDNVLNLFRADRWCHPCVSFARCHYRRSTLINI